MKKLYFLKPQDLVRRMALFYILQIFQVSGLIEDSWILIAALRLIYCDMLLWMKHMKKIWLNYIYTDI